MSATSLQADIISELDSQTTAGRRVYYGTRLQTSLLPAITFEVLDGARATLGNQNAMCTYSVTFTCVADSAAGAASLDAEVRNLLPISLTFRHVCTQFGVIQEPQPEAGEEAGPYLCTSTYTFYQDGP
jgi:hypothetical protein